ncbi:MAG: DUF2085 domain-containing protein [Caldilineales bacterium]|nr:DUF2085 domain-containing protein [Caldilineales bacterium]
MQSSPSRWDAISLAINRFADWLIKRWLLVAIILLAAWNMLPWLAPVFMRLGWELPARGIHTMYVAFCHQLPQRSWFLFGPEFTYRTDDILLAMNGSTAAVTPLTMRAFIGNADMGWKLAWSDRMISFYGGWLLVAMAYALLRRRWRGLTLLTAIFLMLPMLIDGGTHMLSDLGGLRAGFRESNAWLAALTNNAFAPEFYAGDQWGSFNSIARMVTGILAAIGLIGFVFPYIDRSMSKK